MAGGAKALKREGPLQEGADRKGQRFVALCMLGFLLFNYPVLALFNVQGSLFGVPVLYAWLFGAWLFLIVLMARVARGGG
ncbi:MAG: hypothetical protein ACM30H_11240 [Clostridia bacterium]